MRLILRGLLTLAVLAVGKAIEPDARAQAEREKTAVRLAVFDFQRNAVTVLDAATGEVLAGFGMPGPGTVYGSSTGRWFYVIHTAQNRVSVIDSGLRREEHGDHMDLIEGPPFVRGTVVVGRRPIDTWVGNGMLTVHSDDDGTLAVFEDRRLEAALDYIEIRGAGTGHNNGLVLGDYVLLSLASAGEVSVYRMDGTRLQPFTGCPRTHGWALRGTLAAAGCADGVMLFSLEGEEVRMTKIANPPDTPDNIRVGTVRSNPNSPVMVGNWGSGVVIIDPVARTLRPVPLPVNPLAFFFTPDGRRVTVLTADGNVHALDPRSGQILATVAAVAPYTAPASGEAPAPRPGMVVGEGVAYITDPPAGTVVEVDTATMTVRRRMSVGGVPTSIGMVSVTGVPHN
jgi:DNA-binding beta-propeller fold protein YncE